MYYPYFRGKQYELLTVRRNTAYMHEHSIIPVIEPVKDGKDILSGLFKCLQQTTKDGLKTIVIINPQVGELVANHMDGTKKILETTMSAELQNEGSNNTARVSIGLIVNSTTDLKGCFHLLKSSSNTRDIVFIHETATSETKELQEIAEWASTVLHMSTEKSYVRQYRFFEKEPKIIKLSDPFAGFKKNRNTEYTNNVESVFTTENVFYSEDNYEGYSDYLTIGKEYSEGGGMPNAVVIHLTYKISDKDNFIHIQHFVSEANRSTNVNVAGKADEAIKRLNSFVQENDISMNSVLERFVELEKNEKFPGLGALKELSMTNHLFVAGGQFG